MTRTALFSAIGWAMLLLAGCGQPSSTTSSDPASPSTPVAYVDPDELAKLIERYEALSVAKRNSLAGDQIIMQIETLMKVNSRPVDAHIAALVREHNEEMVRRALADPDLLEITGTEVAPPPREQ